jgi:hypothetical protein
MSQSILLKRCSYLITESSRLSLSIYRDISMEEHPEYKKLVSIFAQNRGNSSQPLKINDSGLTDANDPAELQRFIDLIRDMFKNEKMTKFEDYSESCATYSNYFYDVDPVYDSIILKEFLIGDNVNEKLLRTKNHIFLRYILSETLTVRSASEFILQSDHIVDVALKFKNILSACRLLPLKYQNAIYSRIGNLYMRSAAVAKINGQNLPKLVSFVIPLFDLDEFSVSGGKTEKEQETEEEAKYCEIVSTLLNTILDSAILLVADRILLSELLNEVWKVNEVKISWELFARCLLSKAVLNYKRKFKFFPVDEMTLKEVETAVSKRSSIGDLAISLLAIYCHKLDEKNFMVVLKIITEISQGPSRKGLVKLKVFVTRVLEVLPKEKWTDATLPYVRLIQKNNTGKSCATDLLLAAYKSLSLKKPYQKIFCADLLRGIRKDAQSWIEILLEFLDCKILRVNRSDFLAFYGPVKKLAENPDKRDGGKLAESVFTAFAKILVVTNIDCSDDWELFLREDWNFQNSTISAILQKIKFLPSNENVIAQLLIAMTNSGLQNSRTIATMIRIFERSTEPATLAATYLDSVLHIVESPPREFWAFVLFIAERVRTQDIHEKILAMTVEASKSNSFFTDINTARLITFIAERKLWSEEYFLRISKHIREEAKCRISGLHKHKCYYIHASIISALNPVYPYLGAILVQAAVLIQNKRRRLSANLQMSCLLETFKKVLDLAHINTGDPYHFQYKLVLIDFLKAFEEEAYFGELREYLIDKFLKSEKENTTLNYCARIYIISQVKHCYETPKHFRSLLLNTKDWFSNDPMNHYLLQKEHHDVLLETRNLFIKGTLDSELALFAASLLFIMETEPDLSVVFIFTQLAK